MEDSWIRILQNNFKCLLLNDKQTNATRYTVQFVRQNIKHKKINTRESKERKFEKKVREKGLVVLIVVFVFLSSTVVEVNWNASFWNTFHLLWLTAATFMKWFEVFKNNVITFGWQFFGYFYQISNKCCCLIFLVDVLIWISSASQKRRPLNQPWMSETILAY